MNNRRRRVNRRSAYKLLGAGTLAIAGLSTILAIAGAALQQGLSVAAASLCAALFFVPGLYFLGYYRRLDSREIALAHAASFATARPAIRIQELADELRVPPKDAERILRTAIQEGHLRGRFEGGDRFVADKSGRGPSEADP